VPRAAGRQAGPAGEVLDVAPRFIEIVPRIANLGGDLTVSDRGQQVDLILAADVLFAFDKADLTAKSQRTLRQAADLISAQAKGTIRVYGYTDSVGSDSYNIDLSRRRAQAVHQALQPLLAGKGFDFDVQGFGERDPIAPNRVKGKDNPDGRALNRRVTISFPKTP
jgi:outer membrane protein OmpA-like peptidoglycan-associated protein